MKADLIYYARRSAEEKAAAAEARDPRVRDAHLEFARSYDQRISTINAEQRRSEMRLVSAA
jgi:hypothetical protein